MSGIRSATMARSLTLVLDRRGQVLVADRDGRTLWREHEQELVALARRALAEGDCEATVGSASGSYEGRAAVARTGSGNPAVILSLKRSSSGTWSAQGTLEAEKHQSLCRLVGGMVHELRNPLASISLTAELLGMRTELDAQVKEKLQDIVHHVERAEEVLQSLRRFGKEAQPAMRIGSLNQLVEDAVRLERSGIAARRVTIRLELEPELPSVLADASQLRLVISNLIRNAAEAVESAGREAGEVVVRTAHKHGVVRLLIEDDGPGIPPDMLARIFEPYFTTKARGTGVGLAMCAGIVKGHGGHIRAENRRQGGARFQVDFPDPQHSTPALQPTALGIELTHAPTHSALVIDADEDRLEEMRRAIGAIGYRVHVASDPMVALRKLRAADFDVVLVAVGNAIDRWVEFGSRARLAHPEIADRIMLVADEDLPVEIAESLSRAGVRLAVGRIENGMVQALARSIAEGGASHEIPGVGAATCD